MKKKYLNINKNLYFIISLIFCFDPINSNRKFYLFRFYIYNKKTILVYT